MVKNSQLIFCPLVFVFTHHNSTLMSTLMYFNPQCMRMSRVMILTVLGLSVCGFLVWHYRLLADL